MQLYNQFIEFCDSLIKNLTTQWLIYGAFILLSFFLVWIVIATISSSVRRFYLKCDKLQWFVIHNKISYEQINSVDPYASKISRSFDHAWNKFKKSKGKKPSDFLTKREVLDSEVSDGMLNHGKTLMKTFIGVTSVLLFIFNLALLGKDSVLTFGIFVKSMFLPFIYYIVMILMYFISNLIRHQLYTIATAHFYALVDELDEAFVTVEQTNEIIYSAQEEQNITKLESNQDIMQSDFVSQTNETQDEDFDEQENQKLDKLDEDVADDQVEAEQKSEALDLSTFEINRASEINNQEEVEDVPDETEIQESANNEHLDSSELQEEDVQETFDDAINESSTIVEEAQTQEDALTAIPIVRDWEAEENLEYYDVFKKKNINVDKYINEIPNEEEFSSPFINVDMGYVPNDDMVGSGTLDDEPIDETNHPLNEFENNEGLSEEHELDEGFYDFGERHDDEKEVQTIEEGLPESEDIKNTVTVDDEVSEIQENNIEDNIGEQTAEENDNDSSDDDVFNLNDLLIGGDDDEEDYEIETDEESLEQINEESSEEEVKEEADDEFKSANIEDVDFFESNNEDDSLNVDIFDNDEDETDEDDQASLQKNELKSQIEQNLSDSLKEIDSKLEETSAANIDLSALVGEFKQNHQNSSEIVSEEDVSENRNMNETEKIEDNNSELAKDLYAKINDLENLVQSAISNGGKDDGKPQSTKTRKTRKGKTKMTTETETVKKSRGRPKMQAIDENLIITSEEQFEEILSRAEKLMRKSESGLSASQSKRIEKELKIMMDAMNKYKEGK